MNTKADIYIPQVLRSFQGFNVRDLKEWRVEKRLEIILEKTPEKMHVCTRCGGKLGAYKDQHRIRAKHLRMMDWKVEIVFFREKRFCPYCQKVRSEQIDFLCPTSPHVTMELAWWLNRLTEITSVLRTAKLEGIDKQTVYNVDKYILTRLLQGYSIPEVTKISVDEVYARSPRQQKDDETRDDLFLTIVVDLKTHKVIWVSQSRRKEALDQFFELIGKQARDAIEVVAADQHDGYAASVKQYCPNATLVWDKFHLIQHFNDCLNEDRREELQRIDPEGKMGDLMNNKYRYVFVTKASHRSSKDQLHIETVMKQNEKISKLEVIKERFHSMFNQHSVDRAKLMMAEIYQWAFDSKAWNVFNWIKDIREQETFYNYFKYQVTTGVSEGINRVIKGIKWQAYGYKDMFYFALKILQKAGYLNSLYHLQQF